MLHSRLDIQQFLHFGYSFPARLDVPDYLTSALTERPLHHHPDELLSAGATTLNEALHDAWLASSSAQHVVPISGGLDSRVILAWLAQHVDHSRLQCVTLGIPGAYDFEIGSLVAKRVGIRLEHIDLSQMHWRKDDLLQFARDSTTALPLFESWLFHQTRTRFDDACTYWSGFLGDTLAGSHVPRTPSDSWAEAKRRFALWKMPPLRLTRADFAAQSCLPDSPLTAEIGFDDQLDLAVRQEYYIRPLLLRTGYTYAAPFMHPAWVSWSLQAPVSSRRGEMAYRSVISAMFPEMFALPTKTNHGLPLHTSGLRARARREYVRTRASLKRRYPRWFRGALATTNYLDFDEELRRPGGLRDIVKASISALHDRRVIDWLDIRQIWQIHQQRRHNYADALLSLASLEYYLQAWS